jgi:hypothetical protein
MSDEFTVGEVADEIATLLELDTDLRLDHNVQAIQFEPAHDNDGHVLVVLSGHLYLVTVEGIR